MRWTASLMTVALVLSGCAITRVPPPAPVTAPAAFKEDALWRHATPNALPVDEHWWTLFQDPVLDAYEAQLVVGNENLRSVAAQVASARAALTASGAALLPTVSAGLSATRGQNATTSSVTTAAQPPSNTVSLSTSVSWELDLWGRLSQARDQARATLQASTDDLAAARLSAQATLAQTYFALRTAELQQALLGRTVQAYQRSLDLTTARYQQGVAARSDVLQARVQLQSAHAQEADLQAQRAQLEHALAVLLGQPPHAVTVAPTATLPEAPTVPPLLPSQLLERRPDIAAARQRVIAAYAQIGVADAAFFPSLTLSASGGWRAHGLADLTSAPHLFWSLGPSLVQSLLDGGQRRLASDQARASADQLTATYRQTVLTALQEVEDNLALAAQLHREVAWQADALAAARETETITEAQYRAGTVSYLNVVTAQATALNAENTLLSLRNRELVALDTLLKNLGGRWAAAS